MWKTKDNSRDFVQYFHLSIAFGDQKQVTYLSWHVLLLLEPLPQELMIYFL